jgi:hypothetical protein
LGHKLHPDRSRAVQQYDACARIASNYQMREKTPSAGLTCHIDIARIPKTEKA